MARDRKPDVDFQVNRLERRHAELSSRVAELESHTFLSSHERLLVTTLKKEKLAAKDAIVGLKRGH
jgi:hypothetical protein